MENIFVVLEIHITAQNNICYLHNTYSDEMQRYFVFSNNIMAVNCIHTDIQDRANGCDFDSDFFFCDK